MNYIKRRTSHPVRIGNMVIGGSAPIAIQSMTNTDTADVDATVKQILELVDAGSELVRVTVNNEAAAKATPYIKDKIARAGIIVPLIGDFHFNGHLLLAKFPECARTLDKYRINPGNVGSGKNRLDNFKIMIEAALKYDKPVRIGANWGSLDRDFLAMLMDKNRNAGVGNYGGILVDALVESALNSAAEAERLGM